MKKGTSYFTHLEYQGFFGYKFIDLKTVIPILLPTYDGVAKENRVLEKDKKIDMLENTEHFYGILVFNTAVEKKKLLNTIQQGKHCKT